MADQPLVSIVVPCYNSARYLRPCLDSVINQTYDNLECIVVDDGSTDDTKAVVHEYQDKDSRVKYLYQDNGGEASAKNHGLEHACGEWVHVLDSDDWIAPDKIANQVELGAKFRGDHAYVIVYSDYEIVYENESRPNPENVQIIVGELSRQQIVQKIVSRKRGLATPTPITLNSMLLSRNIFDKYKMNEKMPNVADLELYYRILQDNVRCVYAPGISMYYRQHESSMSKDSRKALVGYTMFLDTIYRINRADLERFPNLHRMLRQSILQQHPSEYRALVCILENSEIPVYAEWRGKEVNARSLYRILARWNVLTYWVRADSALISARRWLARSVRR